MKCQECGELGGTHGPECQQSPTNQIRALKQVIEKLKGIKPEKLTRIITVQAGKLPRYGIRWTSPTDPIALRMDDGYWTPYHIAQILINEAREIIEYCMSADTEPTTENILKAALIVQRGENFLEATKANPGGTNGK